MNRTRPPIVAILAFATVAALFVAEGCDVSGASGSVASPSAGTEFGGVTRGAADASVTPAQCLAPLPPSHRFDAKTCPSGEDAAAEPCDGLGCAVERRCDSGVGTTVSGTLYDPAGRNPVANAIVFVPIDPLGHLPTIASGTPACGKCAVFVPGQVVTIALTDAAGHFTLPEAPSGTQIPVVFQAGKWRREIFLPEVRSCAANVVPAALSRLARNQDEGDIPQFALLAGGCDRLACFMRNVGLDASEFTGPEDHGRVHVYQGAGPGPRLSRGTAGDCTGDAGACPLWSTERQLERYDTLLLGCECGENNETKTEMLPLHEWLNAGGNVFAIHSQRTWFKNSPDRTREVANWTDGASSRPFNVDVGFPGGLIFHDWLAGTNALGPDDSLLLNPAQVSTSVASVSAGATAWIFGDVRSVDPGGAAPSRGVSAFSFLAPVGGKPSTTAVPTRSFCGRAVFTDIHPGGADVVDTADVPASCASGEMSAEEKALEFLLFDLTNCLTTLLSNKQGPPPNLSPM